MITARNFLVFFSFIFNQSLFSVELDDKWKLASIDAELGDTYYIDLESIKSKNGSIYVWVMQNFEKTKIEGFRSTKSYWLIECDLMRNKFLQFIFYEKSFGGGAAEYTPLPNDDWYYFPPETSGHYVLKLACESI